MTVPPTRRATCAAKLLFRVWRGPHSKVRARPRECFFAKMCAHPLYIPPFSIAFSAMLPFSFPISPARGCHCVSVHEQRDGDRKSPMRTGERVWQNAFLALSRENVSGSQQTTSRARGVGEAEGQREGLVDSIRALQQFRCFLLSCSIGILPSYVGGIRVYTCHRRRDSGAKLRFGGITSRSPWRFLSRERGVM